jgi:hypothetical protein
MFKVNSLGVFWKLGVRTNPDIRKNRKTAASLAVSRCIQCQELPVKLEL